MMQTGKQMAGLNDQKTKDITRVVNLLKQQGFIVLKLELLVVQDGRRIRLTCRNKANWPTVQALSALFNDQGLNGELEFAVRLGTTGKLYWSYRVNQVDENSCSVLDITMDELQSTIYLRV